MIALRHRLGAVRRRLVRSTPPPAARPPLESLDAGRRARLTEVDPDALDVLVRGAYHVIMGREPDEEGVRFHVDALRAGSPWELTIAGLLRGREIERKEAATQAIPLATRHRLLRTALVALLQRSPLPGELEKLDSQVGSKPTWEDVVETVLAIRAVEEMAAAEAAVAAAARATAAATAAEAEAARTSLPRDVLRDLLASVQALLAGRSATDDELDAALTRLDAGEMWWAVIADLLRSDETRLGLIVAARRRANDREILALTRRLAAIEDRLDARTREPSVS